MSPTLPALTLTGVYIYAADASPLSGMHRGRLLSPGHWLRLPLRRGQQLVRAGGRPQALGVHHARAQRQGVAAQGGHVQLLDRCCALTSLALHCFALHCLAFHVWSRVEKCCFIAIFGVGYGIYYQSNNQPNRVLHAFMTVIDVLSLRREQETRTWVPPCATSPPSSWTWSRATCSSTLRGSGTRSPVRAAM